MPKLKLLREAYKPYEYQIQASIMRFLDSKKIINWSSHGVPPFIPHPSSVGVPDILGIIPGGGRILGIEVKRPGNQPTIAQLAFMEAIRKSGGVAFVASSVEEVESQLEITKK